MILAADVGNSNIVMGVWGDEGGWINILRFDTHPATTDRYQKRVADFLDKAINDFSQITEVLIGSVVPEAVQPISAALNEVLSVTPKLLDASFNTGIKIERTPAEKVGTDLIADAVGAYELVKDNCIAVDIGTATTIMFIENPGVLAGGAICAGLKTTKEALIGNAALLADMPLQPPPSPLGKSPAQTIQSGLIYGHIAMIEGLIERMKQEAGAAETVATGGFVEMLAPLTDVFDHVEPTLTLDGLRLIAERQK